MAKVFFSFRYKYDNWRVQTLRNIGSIEEQPLLSTNDWEDVKRGGYSAVQRWINEQMKYKSCVVVLIGSETAGRKWVKYEIEHGWNSGKGVVGIYINKLKDVHSTQSPKGRNPLGDVSVGGRSMVNIVKTYDSPYLGSQETYDYIKNNIHSWIDEAITIRKNYR